MPNGALSIVDKAAAPAAAAPFVDIENVSLRYGESADTLAITDLRMTVGKGEFAAVVGPSGCGKSSLMKLVTGLLPPTTGDLRVAGARVTGPLKIVGMAFQNSTLLPWRDILSNTMLPLEIVQPHRNRLRRNRKEYEELACNLLATVGLRGFEKKHPWMLSGGMQQRTSLCRSLIHSPELLMLDEPFGALDAFTREELWAVLQDLWMQRRFTCILVTHDLREAAYLADVIYVMSARPGRIVATHRVDLPRPRTVESTFDPKFVDIVHKIRSEIAQARSDDRQRTAAAGAA
ncbi:ABC transporter ATP-binding protein [Propylenella binzhouense]|uniref:ABC transporter ATP-binding protein n=1 Tax=Propylenella binzhouense TaxID=2555902 RepID=UPI001FE81F39|nr:ABC transporter ATP-binding protein [Propylenella binzhouense]